MAVNTQPLYRLGCISLDNADPLKRAVLNRPWVKHDAAANTHNKGGNRVQKTDYNIILLNNLVFDVGYGPQTVYMLPIFEDSVAVSSVDLVQKSLHLAPFQLTNHFPNSAALTNKGALVRSLHRYYSSLSASNTGNSLTSRGSHNFNTPQIFDTIPTTYYLTTGVRSEEDSPVLASFLKRMHALVHQDPIERSALRLPPSQCERNLWIVKPASGGTFGMNSAVFSTPGDLATFLLRRGEHLMGDMVIQKLIERPLTIRNRKLGVRLLVLVLDTGDIYCWRPPVLSLAAAPYAPVGIADVGNVRQVQSIHNASPFAPGAEPISLAEVELYFRNPSTNVSSPTLPHGHSSVSSPFVTSVLPRMRQMALEAVKGALSAPFPTTDSLGDTAAFLGRTSSAHPVPLVSSAGNASMHLRAGSQGLRCFELFSADFVIAEDLTPWLLGFSESPLGSLAHPNVLSPQHALWIGEEIARIAIDPLFPIPPSPSISDKVPPLDTGESGAPPIILPSEDVSAPTLNTGVGAEAEAVFGDNARYIPTGPMAVRMVMEAQVRASRQKQLQLQLHQSQLGESRGSLGSSTIEELFPPQFELLHLATDAADVETTEHLKPLRDIIASLPRGLASTHSHNVHSQAFNAYLALPPPRSRTTSTLPPFAYRGTGPYPMPVPVVPTAPSVSITNDDSSLHTPHKTNQNGTNPAPKLVNLDLKGVNARPNSILADESVAHNESTNNTSSNSPPAYRSLQDLLTRLQLASNDNDTSLEQENASASADMASSRPYSSAVAQAPSNTTNSTAETSTLFSKPPAPADVSQLAALLVQMVQQKSGSGKKSRSKKQREKSSRPSRKEHNSSQPASRSNSPVRTTASLDSDFHAPKPQLDASVNSGIDAPVNDYFSASLLTPTVQKSIPSYARATGASVSRSRAVEEQLRTRNDSVRTAPSTRMSSTRGRALSVPKPAAESHSSDTNKQQTASPILGSSTRTSRRPNQQPTSESTASTRDLSRTRTSTGTRSNTRTRSTTHVHEPFQPIAVPSTTASSKSNTNTSVIAKTSSQIPAPKSKIPVLATSVSRSRSARKNQDDSTSASAASNSTTAKKTNVTPQSQPQARATYHAATDAQSSATDDSASGALASAALWKALSTFGIDASHPNLDAILLSLANKDDTSTAAAARQLLEQRKAAGLSFHNPDRLSMLASATSSSAHVSAHVGGAQQLSQPPVDGKDYNALAQYSLALHKAGSFFVPTENHSAPSISSYFPQSTKKPVSTNPVHMADWGGYPHSSANSSPSRSVSHDVSARPNSQPLLQSEITSSNNLSDSAPGTSLSENYTSFSWTDAHTASSAPAAPATPPMPPAPMPDYALSGHVLARSISSSRVPGASIATDEVPAARLVDRDTMSQGRIVVDKDHTRTIPVGHKSTAELLLAAEAALSLQRAGYASAVGVDVSDILRGRGSISDAASSEYPSFRAPRTSLSSGASAHSLQYPVAHGSSTQSTAVLNASSNNIPWKHVVDSTKPFYQSQSPQVSLPGHSVWVIQNH